MDLLLWRHAEAVEGENDMQRTLTARGEKQARQMASWIREHQPKDLRILVSPAVRCQQTVNALGLPFETIRKLGPGASVSDIVAACGWPNAKGSILIVGHQPGLGRLASLLLSGNEMEWSIKKGALWWISSRLRAESYQTVLRAALSPDHLAD